MFDFLKSRRWPIALDVGADSIKMLQMHKSGAIVHATACARWRFAQTEGQDAQARRQQASQAIGDMLRSGAFHGRWVVSCLPSSLLMVKSLRLPHMDEPALEQAVREEARQRFNFDINQGQLAYLNAGQVRQGTETRDEIIVLAASQETVESHLALLSEAGLKPLHIAAEPVAVFRSFERFLRRRVDEQAVSVLVDIGLGATRVIVARGRQIVFIKSIEIGGRKLNEAVANRLNLSYAEASELRMRVMREHGLQGRSASPASGEAAPVNSGESLEWTLGDAIRAEVEALAREISLCLRYCSVTFRGLRPEKVLLTGGESYDPNLTRLLTGQLTIECVVGQPLRGIELSAVDFGADRRGMLAEWAVCAGLALGDDEGGAVETEARNEEPRLSA